MAAIAFSVVQYAGVGYHASYLGATDPEKITIFLKYLTAIEYLYFGSVNLSKFAILLLYRQLFPNKNIRVVVHILIAVLITYSVTCIIVACVQCRPFAANWDPTLPGAVCIDKEALFIWASMPNIVTDLVILVLPIRVIWNLHTTQRLKIGLIVTFTFGSLWVFCLLLCFRGESNKLTNFFYRGLITSVVRFTTFFRHNSFIDPTFSAVDLVIWTEIEAGVYLISACMLTYRPLLERFGRKSSLLSKFTRVSASKVYNAKGYKVQESKESERGKHPEISMQAFGPKLGFQRLGGDGKQMDLDREILVTTNIDLNEEPRSTEPRGRHEFDA
ncbi:MAG: hypothetical protein MMC33_009146 [Icmadophila ericetorum]|nr:hypothetical protein [Icmadophila ericetorum]